MNPRYLAVFRSHRTLFLLPVVIAGALALWAPVAAPPMYRSSVTLWSDAAGGSSSWLSGSLTPAAQDQQLLDELLTTRYFQRLVARNSPLAEYLQNHHTGGWGPAALVATLRSAPNFDGRIATALGRTKVSAPSPHLLQVAYDAPTPGLAQSTLKAIVKEFMEHRGAFRKDALAEAGRDLTDASAAVHAARTNLTRYLAAHPGSTTKNDPQLKELATTERMAVETLAKATEAVNGAATSLTGSPSHTTLRVVDSPQLASHPTRGKKQLLIALLAGLLAGTVVSVIGIVAVAKIGENKRLSDERGSSAETATAEGRRRSDKDGAAPVGSAKQRRRAVPIRPLSTGIAPDTGPARGGRP